MMQVEAEYLHLHQPSWQNLYYSHALDDFCSPTVSVNEEEPSSSLCISTICSFEEARLLPLSLPSSSSELPFPDVNMIEDVCDWLTDDSDFSPQVTEEESSSNDSIHRFASSMVSDEFGSFSDSSTQNLFSLVFPGEAAEVNRRSGVFHLIRAYGEAKASEQQVLAQVILKRLKDGSSPLGNTLERMAYHFVQASGDDQWVDHDHLTLESVENFAEAFCAFYQTIPVGKFAHLAADSAILNAIPEDAGEIHIVDFDIEEGIQWAPLIFEIASRGWRTLRLTSTRWGDRQALDGARERFRETEGRLCKLASSLGVKLAMEEIGIERLVAELSKRGITGEFLAFNCMVGLPHMSSSSSLGASRVAKFLRAAKDCIDGRGGNRGIIVLGDSMGLEEKWVGHHSNEYSSFLESKLVQMQTLFEAMEFHFPENFGEARIAMECLFLGPHLMSQIGFLELEEILKATNAISQIGLRPRTICETQVVEAKYMVREGESPYWVRTGGGSGNEMSLSYLGTKLARLSCWN